MAPPSATVIVPETVVTPPSVTAGIPSVRDRPSRLAAPATGYHQR